MTLPSLIIALRRRLSVPRAGRLASKKRRPELARPPYADRHEGATLLVLGNGPSLRTHRDALRSLIERERPVVLGANHVTPFVVPDYHAFTNRKRFAAYAHTIDPARSRALLSPYFTDEFRRRHYDGPYEELAYIADNDAPFGIVDGVVQSSCRSVSVLLIGVAIVMGADRILVAGLDGFPQDGGAEMYHSETEILDDESAQHEKVDARTRRFLAQIEEHLERQGREPLAIVTPTVYEAHYRPEILGADGAGP